MNLFRMVVWEFEREWKTPMLELVLAGIAIIAFISPIMGWGCSIILYDKSFFSILPFMLKVMYGNLNSFIYFIIIIITSRSIAGKIEKNEMSLLLSYPIKRTDLIIASLILNIIILIIPTFIFTYFSIAILDIPNALIITIIICSSILIYGLYVYSISFLLSIFTKSTTLSILSSIIVIFGLNYLFQYLGEPIKMFSLSEILGTITENFFNLSKIPSYTGFVIISYLVIILMIIYVGIKIFSELEV